VLAFSGHTKMGCATLGKRETITIQGVASGREHKRLCDWEKKQWQLTEGTGENNS
jgi:hypothetical protein